MTFTNLTDVERQQLAFQCFTCGHGIGVWCKTGSGQRAYGLHASRWIQALICGGLDSLFKSAWGDDWEAHRDEQIESYRTAGKVPDWILASWDVIIGARNAGFVLTDEGRVHVESLPRHLQPVPDGGAR